MDFRILGPLEACDERGAVALGGIRQRALLALLIIHANETLTTDRLVDDLWGERPPATPVKTLQMHVSRLRRALAGDPATTVVTRDHGYQLRVAADRIDAVCFERLSAQGRATLAAGDAARAADALERALGLWRGRALADLADEPFARMESARLEDLRIAATEQLMDARLQLGADADLVAALQALIAEHPYRERLRAQLMLALYRADRQADALQAYQDARRRLVDELGIEPGERLRELERGILAQDPALARPTSAGAGMPHAEPAPAADLPSGVVTFVLTDIEGSSALWDEAPAHMPAALERHDALLAEALGRHEGRTLKAQGEGDSTLTVFRRASDAVQAAAAMQSALAAEAWPGDLTLRVRIAIHTGEAHERDGDYFGPTLNRAARLRALAEGGDVVLSQATAEIVRDHLPAGIELDDRGDHELAGMARPERVFALRRRAAPAPAAAAPETRKTVTAIFATVADPRVSALDPEPRRHLMDGCLARLGDIARRHGATVQAYPGNVLLAVFGVPVVHEDDAARALRAITAMRADAGVGAHLRAGVGTGEAVVEAERPVVSGPAVEAAQRLEAVALPGEILLDEPTRRLARGAARTEPAGVRTDRAGAEAPAVRLVDTTPGARPPRLDAPLVDRRQPLAALAGAHARAVADRTCHLVTVLGAAGVGKTRLAREFVAGLAGGATVLHGRCLSYGEGITYWPLAEIVRDLTGGPGRDPGPVLVELLDGDPRAGAVVEGIGAALGLPGASATSEQTAWAVRTLLEAMASRQPVVVVVDDLHWAEPTLLDLLAHVADLARTAPIVLVGLARPELLDERPDWGGGKLNATTILIEPLAAEDAARHVAHLLPGAAVAPGWAPRIATAAEGNPLFAEELLGELEDRGLLAAGAPPPAELPVAPTIHALLAARLERLPDDERGLLGRVSVEGATFHAGAARMLADELAGHDVERLLGSLVRRDLIRPDRSSLPGEDAYRFRHALVRDAAYRSLSKRSRADLHGRLAAWLDDAERPAGSELDELTGYHLEQAWRMLTDLGEPQAGTAAVAREAAGRLERAGRRALARSDRAAAIGLLERAARLCPAEDPRRPRLLADLGMALIDAGRLAQAGETLARAADGADAAGTGHVEIARRFLDLQLGAEGGSARALAVVDGVLPVFRRTGDEHGLCRALRLRAWVHWIEARAGDAATAWEQAARHAGRAGAEHERTDILGWLASSLFFGPTPVGDAIGRCEAIRAQVAGDRAIAAEVLQPLAALHAMQGRFERARELLRAGKAALADLGLSLSSAVSHHVALVELLAGEPAAAERHLREGYRLLESMGDRALLSTTAAFLARAMLAQGAGDEAGRLAQRAAQLAAGDDLITQVMWRGVRARVLADRGETDTAVALAETAVSLAAGSDFLSLRGDAHLDAARVLAAAGQVREAERAVATARRLYAAKGNIVAAAEAEAVARRGAGLRALP